MNWFKKRRQEKARKEATEIGFRAVDSVNASMSEWEAKCLQTRRAMLANFFDERITNTGEGQGLNFDDWAEIEALALLQNWIEKKEEIVQEIGSFVDPDAWDILKVLGVEEDYLAKLYERFDDVGHELANDVAHAIEQERERRGIG